MGGRNNSTTSAASTSNTSSRTKHRRIIHGVVTTSVTTSPDQPQIDDPLILSKKNITNDVNAAPQSIDSTFDNESKSDVSDSNTSQTSLDFPDFITGSFVSNGSTDHKNSQFPIDGFRKHDNRSSSNDEDLLPQLELSESTLIIRSQLDDVPDMRHVTHSASSEENNIDSSESGREDDIQLESSQLIKDDESSDGKSLTPEDIAQVLKTDDGKIIVVKKDSKKSDGLTIGKLIVSGAAAITASIITTRLAGTVNGLLIVGVSSVVIAVLNEIYRRLFAKMKKISAQAVVSMPLDKILPDKMARKVNDDLQSVLKDTSTLPVIEEVKMDDVEDDSKESHSAEANTIRSKVNAKDVKSAYESISSDNINGNSSTHVMRNEGEIFIPRLRDLIHENGLLKGFRKWLGIEWRSWSWITKSMVIILSFTVLSAGVSVVMSSIMERPEINVTNVTKHDVKDLSDAEKNAIKDAAVQAVQEQLNDVSSKQSELDKRISSLESASGKTTNSNENNSISPSPSLSMSDKNTTDHESDVEALRGTVTELQKEVDALKAEGGNGDGTGLDSDVKSRIDALTSRMDAIDAKIQKLESNGGASSNPTPSNGSQS